MLIAITSEESESSSLVAEKFGRAPFIIFYDTENNTYESLRNPYADLFGGAGIQTSQFIIENKAAAVIAIDIGPNSLRFLKSAGIKVYSCSKKHVVEIVNEFLKENLQQVENEDVMSTGRKRYRGKGINRNRKFKGDQRYETRGNK